MPGSGGDDNGKSPFLTFWTTLPGILTGVAAVITATVGLVTLLNSGSAGDDQPASSLGQPQVTTPATSSTTEPTAGEAEPEVLAHGRLAMVRGDQADLERGLIETSPRADLIFGPESTPHLFATASAFLAPGPGRGRPSEAAQAHSRHDTTSFRSSLNSIRAPFAFQPLSAMLRSSRLSPRPASITPSCAWHTASGGDRSRD